MSSAVCLIILLSNECYSLAMKNHRGFPSCFMRRNLIQSSETDVVFCQSDYP